MNKAKKPPLELIVWANLMKWQKIKEISDKELSSLLGVDSLKNRKKSYYLTTSDIDVICNYFDIEPEKLFER